MSLVVAAFLVIFAQFSQPLIPKKMRLFVAALKLSSSFELGGLKGWVED